MSNDCSTIRGGCEKQMASYAFKHASEPLSDKPFLHIQCTLTDNSKTSDHMWMFSLSNYCYIIGEILCAVQSCTRDPTGELQLETCIGRFLKQDYVHILQAHIYVAIQYATTVNAEILALFQIGNFGCTRSTKILAVLNLVILQHVII